MKRSDFLKIIGLGGVATIATIIPKSLTAGDEKLPAHFKKSYTKAGHGSIKVVMDGKDYWIPLYEVK
jgi:hypothetical protein